MNKLVLLIAARLCSGILCACRDGTKVDISAVTTVVDSAVNDNRVTDTMITTSEYIDTYDDAETAGSFNQTLNHALLTIDDLLLMTGEEIRVAYVQGEVFAKDLFLSSDIEYINSTLNELYLHYTEKFNSNYKYPNFEPVPVGADLTKPFSLDDCEIISHDTRSEYPIELKYDVGDYYLYIGFEPWDMYFEASGDISNIKWHPIVSYFIPVSDEVLEPYAVFDDIHIYIQEFVQDSEDIKRTLKAVDISTGYSIYPSQLAYYLTALDNLLIEYNGTNKVAIQTGRYLSRDSHREIFAVLDFAGELYYNEHYLFMTPYLYYFNDEPGRQLTSDIHWVDENTLEASNENGIFHFTMRSYQTIVIHDDGTSEIVDEIGPIEYIE